MMTKKAGTVGDLSGKWQVQHNTIFLARSATPHQPGGALSRAASPNAKRTKRHAGHARCKKVNT
eukprot:scaffold11318_cov68-Skeletonema_dohrnii-CCMP3373.AAC.2